MTWRIDAIRRFPDESVEQCLERRYEGVGGRRGGAQDVTDDEQRWMRRVVEIVLEIWPGFSLLEVDLPHVETGEPAAAAGTRNPWRISLFDDAAAVGVDVYPDRAHVVPVGGYAGDEGEGFALFWRICQVLAREASCVIVDPNDIEVIEMALDVPAAREEYGWM